MLHTEPSIERPWPTSQEIININSKTRGIYNVHEYNVKQETIHYELE